MSSMESERLSGYVGSFEKSVTSDHLFRMSSGVKERPKEIPFDLYSLTLDIHVPPNSYVCPDSGHSLLAKRATKGTTKSGLTASSISSLIIVLVIAVAAIGAMALTLMLYLAPSLARVLVSPNKPDLAEE